MSGATMATSSSSTSSTPTSRRYAAADDDDDDDDDELEGDPSESVVTASAPLSDDSDGPLSAVENHNTANKTTTNNNNNNNKTLFVTPSDLIGRLNESLSEQLRMSDNNDNNNNPRPLFELHKRLPDGSAVPASSSDVRAMDFQAKLQQAASEMAQLVDQPEQKLAWAERQRQAGNQLYQQGDYRAALDVYLTCLTAVAANLSPSHSPPPLDNHPGNDEDAVDSGTVHDNDRCREFQLLWAKVMNNLALTTLQLEWYNKTIQFCTLGLQTLAEQQQQQQVQQHNNSNTTTNNNNDVEDEDTTTTTTTTTPVGLLLQQLCRQKSKLHYLRAKASRLRGEYDRAVSDLEASKHWLLMRCQSSSSSGDNDTTTTTANSNTDLLLRTVEQERHLLQRAQLQAQQHAQQQRHALQQLWMCSLSFSQDKPPMSTSDAPAAANGTDTPQPKSKTIPARVSLYRDKDSSGAQSVPHQRPYSKLRARIDVDDDDDTVHVSSSSSLSSSCWQWYLERLGRGAQRLLDWLDERELQRRRSQQHQQQQRASETLLLQKGDKQD